VRCQKPSSTAARNDCRCSGGDDPLLNSIHGQSFQHRAHEDALPTVLPVHLGPLRTRVRDRDQQKPFGRWGEGFGDDAVAAAMIDRLVHHAEVISLKGDSYRMRGRGLGRIPPTNSGE
jgi:hypothetical protein